MSDEKTKRCRDELRQVFDLIDADHSGAIDLKELGNGMRAIGGNPTDAEIKAIMQEADSRTNPSGKIEFNEFCDLMTNHVMSKEEEAESLQRAFTAFDRNGDGRIDKRELRDALTKVGLSRLTDDEVNELFQQADKDNSGFIDYRELVAVLTNSCN